MLMVVELRGRGTVGIVTIDMMTIWVGMFGEESCDVNWRESYGIVCGLGAMNGIWV